MLRTVLFAPRTFFEERRDDFNGVTGGGLVLAFAVASTTVLAIVLRIFTATLPNSQVTMVCQTEGGTATACGDLAGSSADVGSVVWQRSIEALPLVFVAMIGVSLLLAVTLYIGAKLGGGTGTFGATVEITAWGLLPLLGAVLVGLATFLVFASQLDLIVSSPEAIQSQLEPIQRGTSGLLLLAIQLGGAVWQAYIWTAGLRVVHGIHRYGAMLLAVFAATIPVVLV